MKLLLQIPKSGLELGSELTNPHLLESRIDHALIHLSKLTSLQVLSNYQTGKEKNSILDAFSGYKIKLHNIFSLSQAFQEEKLDIDLAFFSGLDIRKLLKLRNLYQPTLPVIGMVRELGFRHQFQMLEEVLIHATELDSLICGSQAVLQNIKIFKRENKIRSKIKLKYIPYGVEVKKFKPATDKVALRKKYKLPTKKKILLHVSKMDPYLKMDIFPLLVNMQALIKDNPNILLVIIGRPAFKDYYNHLKTFIKSKGLSEHVMILNQVKYRDIYKYYQMADVFVSLADRATEDCRLSIIEAMSCGLPVIVSDIGGQKNIIKDGKQGYSVSTFGKDILEFDRDINTMPKLDFGDIIIQSVAINNEQFRDRVKTLVSNKKIYKQMSEQARIHAKKHHTFKSMIQAYSAYFQEQITYVSTVKVKLFPRLSLKGISQIIANSVSHILQPTDTLRLSLRGHYAIEMGKLPPLFEKHINSYKLVSPILILLNKKEYQVQELESILNESSTTIHLNVLYLLKQDLIKIAQS